MKPMGWRQVPDINKLKQVQERPSDMAISNDVKAVRMAMKPNAKNYDIMEHIQGQAKELNRSELNRSGMVAS